MELSWFITAILGFIVLNFIFYLSKLQKNHWGKLGIPYVESPSFVRELWGLISKKKGLGDMLFDLYKKYKVLKVFGSHLFLNPVIIICDPEIVNHVLVKDFSYFEDRSPPIRGARDLLQMGISNLTGAEWRTVRHKITPTFTSCKLKMMFDPIKECSDKLVHYIDSKIREDFEASHLMLRYILSVIGNVAFGLKLDVLNEKDKQSQDFFKHSSCFLKPSPVLLIKFLTTISYPKIKELLKFRLIDYNVENYFRGLAHNVIKCREKNNSTGSHDFLQLLLDLKKKELNCSNCPSPEGEPIESEDKELMEQLKNTPLGSNEQSKAGIFTDEFISSQTFFFISVGSHITSTVLSFILYELAVNQDLQKKVQDEISKVLNSEEFNYQAVTKLTYMEHFINETLRIRPPVVFLRRICTRDYKIPGSEVVIPKGSVINIPVAALQNDPQYFHEPDKFNPDRFENMDSIQKKILLSFGAGPRMCIAMRLAMLEIKTVLMSLLSNFTVVLSEKTKLPLTITKSSIVSEVDKGVWIKFKRREE